MGLWGWTSQLDYLDRGENMPVLLTKGENKGFGHDTESLPESEEQ